MVMVMVMMILTTMTLMMMATTTTRCYCKYNIPRVVLKLTSAYNIEIVLALLYMPVISYVHNVLLWICPISTHRMFQSTSPT